MDQEMVGDWPLRSLRKVMTTQRRTKRLLNARRAKIALDTELCGYAIRAGWRFCAMLPI